MRHLIDIKIKDFLISRYRQQLKKGVISGAAFDQNVKKLKNGRFL